ncbi:hypothetical protein ACH4YO_07805 [Streptomyces noursei]|uniref:hypothetical protein n=1 Tax=Streptomyces noursei TaxID=1971 RepID=UPI0033EE2E64
MTLEYARKSRGRTDAKRSDGPPAPPNTQPENCGPHEIEVGDYVLVERRYRRVNDMRSRGGASERVLDLEGFGLWVMTTTHLIYRPISRGPVRRIA